MSIEKGIYKPFDKKLLDNEINELLDNKFAKWKRCYKDEKGEDKQIGVAVVKANKNKDNYLDFLARVINVKDTCIAIFFDGESLLISNNSEEKIKYVRKYMKGLREFVNHPFEEDTYVGLVELAIEKIKHNGKKDQYPEKIDKCDLIKF